MWKPHLLRLLVRTGLTVRSGLVHRIKSASAELTDRYREKEAVGRRSLMTGFVSLGENCELGFVQEHLDAHPVDLFRWSGITADHLITALETRLEGIGEAEHTVIRLNPNDLEFYIDDRRYGMVTHTRMSSRQHSQEHALRVFQQRAKRLRVKLLDDLTDGERIFVFQSRELLSSEKLSRLHSAFAKLAPRAELLYVHPAQAGQRPGRIKRIAPGLMVGVIDRAGLDGGPWSISYALWLRLMVQAVRLSGGRPPRGSLGSIRDLGLPQSF